MVNNYSESLDNTQLDNVNAVNNPFDLVESDSRIDFTLCLDYRPPLVGELDFNLKKDFLGLPPKF